MVIGDIHEVCQHDLNGKAGQHPPPEFAAGCAALEHHVLLPKTQECLLEGASVVGLVQRNRVGVCGGCGRGVSVVGGRHLAVCAIGLTVGIAIGLAIRRLAVGGSRLRAGWLAVRLAVCRVGLRRLLLSICGLSVRVAGELSICGCGSSVLRRHGIRLGWIIGVRRAVGRRILRRGRTIVGIGH